MNKAGPVAEPSMEEILASIRRIISDGEEQQRSEAHAAGLGESLSGDPDEADDYAGGHAGPVEADTLHFDQHSGAEEAEVQPYEEVLELTEEMFVAENSAASPTEAPAADVEDEAAMGPDIAPAPPISVDEHDCAAGREQTPRAAVRVDPSEDEVVFAEAPVPGPTTVRSLIADADDADLDRPDSPDSASPGAADAARAPEPGAAACGDEQLLSPAADASVAAAFGRLANTILSQDPRTLEDLVKEMLQPMLREWLDDNLPPLVERLVREEIARVSRGQARR